MFLSRPSLSSEEYHIIILVVELYEMGVKANIALHVDVTGPGNHDSYYVLGGSMFLLWPISLIHATSHSSHLLNTPILGSTEADGGWWEEGVGGETCPMYTCSMGPHPACSFPSREHVTEVIEFWEDFKLVITNPLFLMGQIHLNKRSGLSESLIPLHFLHTHESRHHIRLQFYQFL